MTNRLYDLAHRTICPAADRPWVLSPPRSERGRKGAIIVGTPLVTGIVMLVVFSMLPATDFNAGTMTGFSAQDRHYLAVIHDPCAHSEVLDTTRCRSWGQGHWTWPDDQTLVTDAHDVCAAESRAQSGAKIPTGGSFIAARHPKFFDLQVGVEEVAARNTHCPNVIGPVSEEPHRGGGSPAVGYVHEGSGQFRDVSRVPLSPI